MKKHIVKTIIVLLFLLPIALLAYELNEKAPFENAMNKLNQIVEEYKNTCEQSIKEFANKHKNNIEKNKWSEADYNSFNTEIIKPILNRFNSVFQADSEVEKDTRFNEDKLSEKNNIDDWEKVIKNAVYAWLRKVKGKYENKVKNYYSSKEFISNTKDRPVKEYKKNLKEFYKSEEQKKKEKSEAENCLHLREYITTIYNIMKYTRLYNHNEIFSMTSEFSKRYQGDFSPASKSCSYQAFKDKVKTCVKCSKHGM